MGVVVVGATTTKPDCDYGRVLASYRGCGGLGGFGAGFMPSACRSRWFGIELVRHLKRGGGTLPGTGGHAVTGSGYREQVRGQPSHSEADGSRYEKQQLSRRRVHSRWPSGASARRNVDADVRGG